MLNEELQAGLTSPRTVQHELHHEVYPECTQRTVPVNDVVEGPLMLRRGLLIGLFRRRRAGIVCVSVCLCAVSLCVYLEGRVQVPEK